MPVLPPASTRARPALTSFIALALILGVVGFGGGFAVAQRIKRTVVGSKEWLDEAEFLEAFAVASALPGTTATNLLTVLGYRLVGIRGATAGAIGFLAPSIVLMVAFGAAYDHLRGIGPLASFLDGMSAATIGVVAAVALDLGRCVVKARVGWALALGASVTLATRALNLLEVIAIAGLIGTFYFRPAVPAWPARRGHDAEDFPPVSLRGFMFALPTFMAIPSSIALLVVFARIGVATFGGGFAMIPAIEHEVVQTRGWLTESAFNDAMVLGQITPGPVAIAATFIGYRVAGGLGAALATLGMFGPPFMLSLLAARSMAAFRANPVVQGFLAGVAPAVVGVIVAASLSLWRTTVHAPLGAALALGSFAVLAFRPKLSPLLPLMIGGLIESLVRFG